MSKRVKRKESTSLAVRGSRTSVLKAGVYLKMSGKSDFLLSLELASSTIGLHTGKSCLKVFSKFSFERAVCLQEVYELLLVAMTTELVFCLVFLLFVALRTPQESLKRYFSECSILALEKRYLEKDLFN